MANAPIAYAPEASIWGDAAISPASTKKEARMAAKAAAKAAKIRSKRKLSEEDLEIVAALEAVKSDMELLHNCFDQTTDAILIDSLIYELKAASLKYQYYLELCKEKGIVFTGVR